MATTLRERLSKLTPERRARVEARAAELAREEMTLAELRKAARKTQVNMARRLNVKQASISRLEQRSDLYLSTLRRYVEAIGGELELVVRMPDAMPVRLAGVGDIGHPDKGATRAAAEESEKAVARPPRRRAQHLPRTQAAA